MNERERVLPAEGPGAPPRANGELVFQAPWESRIFGVTLALYEAGRFEWSEFQSRLIAAIARHEGLTEEQLRDLPVHRDSPHFDEVDRTVLDLADALTRSPAIVDDELRSRVEAAFTAAQRAELVTLIAWENKRARLNQGLGVRPSGFSDGEFCALPETTTAIATG